jgi:hypothetical protein
MNKYFKEVVTKNALEFKLSGHLTGALTDSFVDNDQAAKAQFKNVCAPISLGLNDELEYVTGLLRISKRDFLTLAISSAVDEAKILIDEINVTEYHAETIEAA